MPSSRTGSSYPQDDLAARLGECASGLMQTLDLVQCTVWLAGLGTLVSSRNGVALTHSWLRAPEMHEPSLLAEAVRATQWHQPADTGGADRDADQVSLCLEIGPSAGPLGELTVAWRQARRLSQVDRRVCEEAVRSLAHLARCSRSPELTTVPLPSWRGMDEAIHRVAQTSLSLLVVGERGTGRRRLALEVHLQGPRRHEPFEELACDVAGVGHRVASALRSAAGGTLLFHALDRACEEDLATVLRLVRRQRLQLSPERRPRLLATVVDATHRGPVQALVLELFDVLRLELVPLRKRPRDVAALVRAVLAELGRGEEPDDWLVRRCLSYPWPGNDDELRKLVSRIGVLCDAFPPSPAALGTIAPELSDAPSGPTPLRSVVPGEQPSEIWVGRLVRGELGHLQALHPGVQRALPVIARRFYEPLGLSDVARRCGVSPRYLSALLRREVGLSFKPLLTALRAEHAAARLLAEPHARITEVAQEVGFADLSHFERIFRRRFGVSPREYRRAARAGA